jgi:hypothetical protein
MATSEAEARAALMRLRESEELVHYLTEGVGEQDAVEAMRSLLDQHARSLELRRALRPATGVELEGLKASASKTLEAAQQALHVGTMLPTKASP